MRRIWIAAGVIAFVISLTIAPALAQESKGEAEKADPSEKKEAEAPAGETEAPEEELTPVTGEKIEVLLREGDVLQGVVKGARVEVMVNGRYRKANSEDDKGAGIRVYYAMGLNGFVFVPYATIEKIDFNGELSVDEGIALARRIAAERRESEQERVRIADEMAEKKRAAKEAAEKKKADEESIAAAGDGEKVAETGEKAAPSKKEGEATLSESDRTKLIRDLLTRYPPTDWKPSRLAEIKDRQLILSIYPTEEERGFMKNYDLWLKGYEIWQKQKASQEK